MIASTSIWTRNEKVLAVPASLLDGLGRFQGFQGNPDRWLNALLESDQAKFLPRAEAEEDPSHKQLIPYVIIRSGNLVFCYTRGRSQGESRLHHRKSLGVGGHIDEIDAAGRTTRKAYEAAVQREIEEEVAIASPGWMRCVGLINDDATAVGRVHLGLVHLYELDRPEVHALEDGIADSEFVPVSNLRDHWDRFESWSQICIEAFLDPSPE